MGKLSEIWEALKRGGEKDGVSPNDQGTEAWFVVLTLPFVLVVILCLFLMIYSLS